MMQTHSTSRDEDMVRGRRMRTTERCGKASRDHLWLFLDTPDTGHTAARGGPAADASPAGACLAAATAAAAAAAAAAADKLKVAHWQCCRRDRCCHC